MYALTFRATQDTGFSGLLTNRRARDHSPPACLPRVGHESLIVPLVGGVVCASDRSFIAEFMRIWLIIVCRTPIRGLPLEDKAQLS